MKVTIKIAMDNAAFDEDCGEYELARILRETADLLQPSSSYTLNLRDINGNRVGELKVSK